MKYCVNYRSKFIAEADEIRVPANQLGLISDHAMKHQEQRIIVCAARDSDRETVSKEFTRLQSFHSNVVIAVPDIPAITYYASMKIPVFLDLPVTDWESFNRLIKLGVTDVWVDGPLAMDAPAKQGITVRTRPAASPNAMGQSDPASFYIRPEDVHSFFTIDVCEFVESNQERADTLYKIYKRGSFEDRIALIIPQLSEYDIYNGLLPKDFSKVRSCCGMKCKAKSSCHYCNLNFSILDKMEQLYQTRKPIDK